MRLCGWAGNPDKRFLAVAVRIMAAAKIIHKKPDNHAEQKQLYDRGDP
jgi:hypothetical protein